MRKWLVGILVLGLMAGGVYLVFMRQAPVAAPVPTAAVLSTTDNQVIAAGRAVPVRTAALSFSAGGVITDVLVQLGDHVAAGQLLTRLDATQQRLRVAQAQAELSQAQANYQNLLAGPTTGELAVAEAQLRQAQAQLHETSGSVTNADLRAAEATLQQAQAQLARLRAGSNEADLRAAEAALRESQADNVSQRDRLSATKTNAALDLDRAAQALTQAQSGAATAKSNWEYVQRTGVDPVTPKVPDPERPNQTKSNKLGDTQRQHYYDAFVQADAAMHSAESAVQQAQVAYDTARQAEVSGVEAAGQRVASAQANLDKLRGAADADQIAAAQAQVAIAQANLDKLRGGQRDGALDAAQAAVDVAQAHLDQLRSGAAPGVLAQARAQVQSAQAALDLARSALNDAELHASFAGVVGAIAVRRGEYAMPGVPVIQLADLTAWQVETNDLSALGAVRVQVGDRATISFDAIPDLQLSGTVRQIAAFGESKQGDIVYTAVIAPDRQDERLRWNMTASVTITTK
jgi:HlyD family secretion protein